MTQARSDLGAIVLAGGRSSRFGRDKLIEPIDGRALLLHAIAAVQAIEPGIKVVVVVAPDATPALPGGVRLAHDARAFDGPLAGLAAGLAALDDAVELAIVVGGDMPSLVPAVLRRLLAAVRADPTSELALLHDDDRPRPLPAAVRRVPAARAARSLLAADERRLRALSAVLATVVLPLADWRALDPARRTLRDVDVPADLTLDAGGD